MQGQDIACACIRVALVLAVAKLDRAPNNNAAASSEALLQQIGPQKRIERPCQ
jgi:hypothetical protein